MRVAVEFGKSKLYTGIVLQIHQNEPVSYQAKEIHHIIDNQPLLTQYQLQLWEWISNYYLCTLGEVMRSALPSAFLLESETIIYRNESFQEESILTDNEFLIFEALQQKTSLTVSQISAIIGNKEVLPLINGLISKSVLYIKEEIFAIYKPKLVKYVTLTEQYNSDEKLQSLLTELARAKKQRQVLLTYFQLLSLKKPIKLKDLELKSEVSYAVLKALIDKNILEVYTIQQDRVNFSGEVESVKKLNEFQQHAFSEIQKSFIEKDITLLQGVTGSGKTEIYTQLIKDTLKEGKQVLFLLPEIALTTQIINRLKRNFGSSISVFHSKYSINERVEVWNNLLNKKQNAQIILGVRSSVLLPFSNLGLIIIDEEHETSYKQNKRNPRYQARDSAIVLAKMHKAKVLLGSATPSLETKFNTQSGKYGLVMLTKRFGNVQLPQIELIDVKEKYRKKRMKGHFSDRLLELMNNALEENEQIILFQNRRGFSPIIECTTCGVSPQCPNCDVSLTYHKYKSELKCHYCNYQRAMPNNCVACGSTTLDTKGFGTEQIELELHTLFPNYSIARMDLDTTKGKYGYEKIITAFEAQEIDILVGTQMLSKGLDFSNVSLVGVLNADSLLNFPDFRAHERAFQLLLQVSGRSGRSKKRGQVAIQTFNPYHQILQQVSEANYDKMFQEQLQERWQYKYPPYYRLIKVTLKHKDYTKVDRAIDWLFKSFQMLFKENVLGPSTPAISRIRNKYIKNITIKIPPKQSLIKSKEYIEKVKRSFEAIPEFRSVQLIVNVDPS